MSQDATIAQLHEANKALDNEIGRLLTEFARQFGVRVQDIDIDEESAYYLNIGEHVPSYNVHVVTFL